MRLIFALVTTLSLAGCAGMEALYDPPVAKDSAVFKEAKDASEGEIGKTPDLSEVQRMLKDPPKIDNLGEKVDDLNTTGVTINADPWAQLPTTADTDAFAREAQERADPGN